MACLALAVIGLTASTANAQYVLGGWQGSGPGWGEGWYQDNYPNANTPIENLPTVFTNVAAGVTGYPLSLEINSSGYGQNLEYSIAGNTSALTAFNNNHLLSFTFAVPAATNTAGYSQVYSLIINAAGYGYNAVPWSSTTSVDLQGTDNNSGGMPNYYYGPSGSVRSQTVTYDYSSILPSIIAGGEGYLDVEFVFNNGGGAPTVQYLNNVVLSGGPIAVPEPASMALCGLGLAAVLFLRRRKA